MAGFWKKVLAGARLGAIIAGKTQIKGVPVETIAQEAEQDGKVIADSVQRFKDARKQPATGSTGE